MQQDSWDVIIIGGGSAGLSAALMLGRSRRSVLVLDEGAPRNRFAGHMHGVLGRDHTSPIDLLTEGRAELGRYEGVTIRTGVATRARVAGSHPGEPARPEMDDGTGFVLELADGAAVRGRRLLVATGLRDVLPPVTGLAEQWGRGAFLCPYCDGWEVRDRRIAVIATSAAQVHQAQLMRQLSAEVIVFAADAGLPAEAREGLVARGVTVEDRPVAEIVADEPGSLRGVRLVDGTEIAVDAIFVGPAPEPNDPVLRQLGAERAPHPMGGEFAVVDAMGRTSVPGVWAAGNVTDPRSSVPFAMAAGSMAGAAINADLVDEEVRAAVAGR